MIDFSRLDNADIRLVQSGLNRFIPDRAPLGIDGIAGRRTAAAYAAYRRDLEKKADNRVKSEFDKRTEKNLATLNPKAEPAFREFVKEAKELLAQSGLKYIVIGGSRTFAEQDALFAQGRTKSGNIVTNARGGFSNHNFGIAIDGGIFRGRKYLDNSKSATDKKTARRAHTDISMLGKRLGLKWGGDFRSFVDRPHFQFPTGVNLAELRRRVLAGEPVIA